MLLHVVPGQPACLDSPSPHTLPPEEWPRPIGPRKESTEPEAGCLSSQAPGAILLVATCISVSGRMSSVSIGPPGSWPRQPATLWLSRLPQPASRRICPIPPPAAPRGILRSRPAALPRSTPAKRRAIFFYQPDNTYQSRPLSPRLLDPTFHFGSIKAVCADAHPRLVPPLEPFAPQGAGSLPFPAARGSRA